MTGLRSNDFFESTNRAIDSASIFCAGVDARAVEITGKFGVRIEKILPTANSLSFGTNIRTKQYEKTCRTKRSGGGYYWLVKDA